MFLFPIKTFKMIQLILTIIVLTIMEKEKHFFFMCSCYGQRASLASLDTRGESEGEGEESRGRSVRPTMKICQGQDLLSSESY